MNKNLLTILAITALAACSQADTNAAAPKSQEQVQQSVQEVAEMQVTHVDAAAALVTMRARPDLVVIDVRTPS